MSRFRLRSSLLAVLAAAVMAAPSCGQGSNGGHGSAGAGGTQAVDAAFEDASDAQAEDVSAIDSPNDGTGGTAACRGVAPVPVDAGPCGDLSEPCCREYTCHSGLICIGSPTPECRVDTGGPCADDADCAEGICAATGDGGARICTISCNTTADCVSGWTCGPVPGEASSVCQCAPKKEVCDGKDDDCNGIVDDVAPALEACVQANGPGYYCDNGVCACQTLCNGVCQTGSDPQNCGGCGRVCPAAAPKCYRGQCVASSCACAADEVCGGGSCGSHWAGWPMPNPASAGLPNPAGYDTTSVPGVVIDNVTRLMWQRTAGPSMFGFPGSAPPGESYCAQLTLGGYDDWRLPTEIELYSLIDYTTQDPAIDATAFPGLGPKPDASPLDFSFDYFMTTEPAWNLPHGGWVIVDFDCGGIVATMSDSSVRCVRGPAMSASSAQHYTVGSGVVTDDFTHLTWQRSVDANAWGWGAARNYCAQLGLAGGGWRVPSVKELATLVDVGVPQPSFSQAEPAIDSAAFPNTPAAEFWSSSASAADSTEAWSVDFLVSLDTFGDGIVVGTYPQTEQERVRCVR